MRHVVASKRFRCAKFSRRWSVCSTYAFIYLMAILMLIGPIQGAGKMFGRGKEEGGVKFTETSNPAAEDDDDEEDT